MRRMKRVAFILLAMYLIFLGGSAYYALVFPIRVLHHALITILLALWLINRIRRGQGLPETPLNLPIYAAVIVWFVSAAASIAPRMALENIWFPLTHTVFFFVLVDLLQHGRQRLVLETQFLAASAVVVLSGMELASWYFGIGFIPGTGVGWADVVGPGAWLPVQAPRLSLAMNISTLLAGYVAPLAVLSAGWALTTGRRDYRIVLWALTGALLVILVLTFSRGGLLSVLSAGAVFMVLRAAQMRSVGGRIGTRTVFGAALICGIIGVGGFLFASTNNPRSFGDAARVDMWRSAIAMLRDHPLTGVGPGLFGRAYRSYRDPALAQDKIASAHNAYLNTAAETGSAGVAVSVWLAGALVRAWSQNWRSAREGAGKVRLEIAFAALVGMGIHSLVDVFTTTPIVLLLLLLSAYSAMPEYAPKPRDADRTRDDTARTRRPQLTAAGVALGLIVAYGIGFVQVDRAQSLYERSFNDPANALAYAQSAAELDPGLSLYTLHIANVRGQAVLNGSSAEIGFALASYQAALALEPTWDTGWMNLAALAQRLGDNEAALEYLDRARRISEFGPAGLRWAELAEAQGAASDEAILRAYTLAVERAGILPLADFWWKTPLRRQAVAAFVDTLPVDWQYRVLAERDPQRAEALVPAAPQTGAEWWVAGEYALSTENNPEKALNAFGEAIRLAPATGDYYAARARAGLGLDPEAAERDLDIAQLLGTYAEYPNTIRAGLAQTPEETERLRSAGLPPLVVSQEFAAALFGRPANFDLFPETRATGPGRNAMQPWYDIAGEREARGDTDGAIRAYRAILAYAPDEAEAQAALERLGAAGP